MTRIERQATINAPASAVFAYVSDFPRHPEWAGQKLEITPASGGPCAVGSTYTCVGHQMGTHRGEVTVTELVPNERLVFESNDDTGRFRHYFQLKEEAGQTALVKGMEPLKAGAMLKIMGPFVYRFVAPGALGADLKRIKAKLEGQG